MIQPNLSIRQRILLGFSFMGLLVLCASGVGLLYTRSVETALIDVSRGTEQIERIENLKASWLDVIGTIDKILLTRQRGLIERRLNDDLETFLQRLIAFQTQSQGERTDVAAQNRTVINNLKANRVEFRGVVAKLAKTVSKGQWAHAMLLRHNDLASLKRRFNETLYQLSTDIRNQVDKSVAESMRSKDVLRTYWILTALAALALGALTAFLTTVSIIRPVTALVATAQAIRDGDLSKKSLITSRDEIGVLSDAFNRMAIRLAYQIGIQKDEIDERKQVEAALRESEEQVRLLINSTAEAIYGLDLNGNCTFANPSCLRLLGYENAEHELIGKNIHKLIHHSYPDGTPYPAEACTLCDAFKEGKDIHIEDDFLWRSNGTIFPAEFWSYPIYRNDQITGAVVTFLDITERKQAEAELTQYRDHLEELVRNRTAELEASHKELADLCYSMSHNLRAPLRHIDGYMELFLSHGRAGLSNKDLHYLDAVTSSARQMGVLIDNLLEFIHTGQVEMQRKSIDMNQALQEALPPMQEASAGRTIEWVIGELPSVRGDYSQIRQVWANLLGNALKYTQSTEVTRIEVSSHEGDHEIIFMVSDNGVGFDMQYADILFGVFQRLHSQEAFEGNGIGLAIVHRIIKRHGGRVWAEAEPSRGATFYFSLPLTGKS
jgi:PAS domain S-box-containing protein